MELIESSIGYIYVEVNAECANTYIWMLWLGIESPKICLIEDQ